MPENAPINPPASAELDNPLYYLENGLTVVRWVVELHGDLLTGGERARLQQFEVLPQSSQALMLRMVMRTHDEFRASSLNYPEIGQPTPQALQTLVEDGWVDPAPRLSLEALGRLLRRDELVQVVRKTLPEQDVKRSTSKASLLALLCDHAPDDTAALHDWWPDCPEKIVALRESELFRRIRLMFFGNLHQDWTEFVVTALGYQAYEPVPLSPESRAFQTRDEVDMYLALHDSRQKLEGETDLERLWQTIPQSPIDNTWLNHRRCRLLHALGHLAERQGDIPLALQCYRSAWLSESRVRYFRAQEKHGDLDKLWNEVNDVFDHATSALEKESLQRIRTRVAKRTNHKTPTQAKKLAIPTFKLPITPDASSGVEHLVAAALSDTESHCHYVENLLFNGLLGLLCWPAIYKPVPGAFFHPFQSGPADLFHQEFVSRRKAEIEECLNALTTGEYRERIWQCWQSRQGISCPLVAWPVLTETLLSEALTCIPATDLHTIFTRQLSDLSSFRRGLPDLVRFWPDGKRYELIEVKAPGDRLQDHQRHWIAFFQENNIPATVCHVTWSQGR